MKSSIYIALIAAAGLGTAWANGGGYSRGGVSETGTVRGFSPSGTETVRIVDEQLTIKLGPESANVEVRYILKNVGKASSVRFGFPVEELDEMNEMDEEEGQKKAVTRSSPEYCRDYKVEVGGKAIAAKFEAETDAAKERDEQRIGLKGWLVSKVEFDAGEEKTMTIRYNADYPFYAMSVSDDERANARIFRYRISTGAAWEGPIEKGRVVISPAGVRPEEVTVLKPVNRFKKEGADWVWEFTDLEPSLADDIEVEAVPAADTFYSRSEDGGYAEGGMAFTERKGNWYVAHTNYDVKASSTLAPSGGKTYDAANLKSTEQNVWCEGAKGSGVGEWLEITPEVAQPLRSIKIVPGYVNWDDETLFKKNGRPKKLEVVINGDHKFDATLADRSDEQEIAILGYEEPVKSIRLTAKEVYPGAKYEDMCIAKVSLEAKLKKKPNVTPAR